MPRGRVLPFPAPGGLTATDRADPGRVVALFPDAQVEVSSRRTRRVAILSAPGRRLWIGRTGSMVHARGEMGSAAMAEGASIGDLLAAMRSALLPRGSAIWRRCRTAAQG